MTEYEANRTNFGLVETIHTFKCRHQGAGRHIAGGSGIAWRSRLVRLPDRVWKGHRGPSDPHRTPTGPCLFVSGVKWGLSGFCLALLTRNSWKIYHRNTFYSVRNVCAFVGWTLTSQPDGPGVDSQPISVRGGLREARRPVQTVIYFTSELWESKIK